MMRQGESEYHITAFFIVSENHITAFSKELSEQFEGILPKGPYLPCVSMAGRALLAGYPRIVRLHFYTETVCQKHIS